MIRYTQKQLKALVKHGLAKDVTNAAEQSTIAEPYRQVGYSCGVYGCNGMLLQGLTTGDLYAVTARTTAIYLF